MAGIDHVSIYKQTGLDPSYTIAHVRSFDAVVAKAKMPFFKLIEKKGFPTRRARFCCEVLKEYKVLDVAVVGVRKSESTARAKRYSEPQICRVYNKHDRAQLFLPLLDWTDEDVKEFIEQEKIQCHPLYYDADGNFHVEHRLGCLCCPLLCQRRLKEEFKEHPLMVKAYITHGQRFLDTHPNVKAHQLFRDVYDLFFYNTFTTGIEDFKRKTNGLFGKLDTKSYLEDFFKISLP